MDNQLVLARPIPTPSDLDAAGRLCLDGPPQLRFTTRTRVRFDCHWLREETGNRIGGETGRRVATPLEAEVDAWLEGPFRTRVEPQGDGWLRVRLSPTGGGTSDARVEARIVAPSGGRETGNADPLLAWLLGVPGCGEDLRRGLASLGAYLELPASWRRSLARWFGEVRSSEDFARLLEDLDRVGRFRDRLYQAALAALENKVTAILARDRLQAGEPDGALFDGCFAPTGEGLEAYREVVGGGLSRLRRGADDAAWRLQRSPAAALAPETALELHLPLVDKKRWAAPLDLFGQAGIETGEDGRIVVRDGSDPGRYDNVHQSILVLAGGPLRVPPEVGGEEFRLAFTDRRSVPAAYARHALFPLAAAGGFPDTVGRQLAGLAAARGPVEVRLTRFVSGAAAEAWRAIPDERTRRYHEIFSLVSEAVQAALRRWLPWIYFAEPVRFRDKSTAYPLLVYAASRPFRRTSRAEYTYDPLNRSSMNRLLRNAAATLPAILQRTEQLLLDLGMEETAAEYAPRRAGRILEWLKDGNRNLQRLLAGDALLMNHLENLGTVGRQLGAEGAPSTRFLLRSVNQLFKNLHPRLRRYYAGVDLTPLGSLVLLEATRALSAALGRPAPVQAILRWRLVAGADATERVAVGFPSGPAARGEGPPPHSHPGA